MARNKLLLGRAKPTGSVLKTIFLVAFIFTLGNLTVFTLTSSTRKTQRIHLADHNSDLLVNTDTFTPFAPASIEGRDSTVGLSKENREVIVDFSADDLNVVSRAKVFLSKGNSFVASRTRPLVLRRKESIPSQGITFAVLGDWGGGGKGPQAAVSQALAHFATTARLEIADSKKSGSAQSIANGIAVVEGGGREWLGQLNPREYCQQEILPSDYPSLLNEGLVARVLERAQIRDQGLSPSREDFLKTLQSEIELSLATNSTLATEVKSLRKKMKKEHNARVSFCTYNATNSRLDFVVSTGDNIYEAGAASVNDVRIKRNFESVYTDPSLQCPWLMSLGNHDHGAHGILRDVQAQVNYTFLSTRWYLPSTFYSQLVEETISPLAGSNGNEGDNDDVAGERRALSLELFVIDSYDVSPSMSRIREGQLKWLRTALASSTADWRIIVGHRPIYSAGSKHGNSPYFRKRLRPLMEKYNVAAFLSGDDHALQVIRDDAHGQWSDDGGGSFTSKINAVGGEDDGGSATGSGYNGVYLGSGAGARAGSGSDLKMSGVKGKTVFQSSRHGFMGIRLVNKSTMLLHVINSKGEILYASAFSNPHIRSQS